MADRYWVGGSGTWNTTSTTNWSTASGGSGGASVPTAADSVFFDQANTYIVTMTGALNCLDITVSAGVVTFATGTSPTLSVAGNWSTIADTVWNSTGTVTFTATTAKTITSSGITVSSPFTFNGAGGTWTLQDNLTLASARTVTLTQGTLALSSYTLTTGLFNGSGSSLRSIDFGTGKIVLNSATTSTVWNTTNSTNLSYAGTTLIECIGGGTAVTKTITTGAVSEALSANFSFLETSGTVTYAFTASNAFRNLIFNGTQTITNSAVTVYGEFSNPNTNGTTVFTGGTSAWTFAATSGNLNVTPPTTSGLVNTGSVYFTGASANYLTAPNNNTLYQMTGDFTLEAWVYPSGTGTRTIFSVWTPGTATTCSFRFAISTTNKLEFSYGIGSTNTGLAASTNSVALGTWNHVAVTRTGTTVNYFINGVLDATAPTLSGSLNSSTSPLYIGIHSPADGNAFNGYISNARFVKGVAVYSGTFTPPSLAQLATSGSGSAAAYPSTTNVNTTFAASSTSILTCQSTTAFVDNSSNGTTITRVGSPLVTTLGFGSAIYDFPWTFGSASSTATWTLQNQLNISNARTLTWANGTLDYNNRALLGTSGITVTTGTFTLNNTGGTTISTTVPITHSSGTINLGIGLTTTNASGYAHNGGTLNLNTFILTTPIFASGGTSTRAIEFGTGKIVLNGSVTTTIWNSNHTGLTISGTSLVECIGGGTGVTKTINAGSSTTEDNSISFSFLETTGTVTYAFTGSVGVVKNLIFNGVQTISNAGLTIFGSFTHQTTNGTTTFTAGTSAWTFAATSGSYNINHIAGFTYDFPWTFGSSATAQSTATWTLVNNLTLGATRQLTLANGTTDFNNKTLSVAGITVNGSTRTATFINTGGGSTFTTALPITHTSGGLTLSLNVNATNASGYTLTAGTLSLDTYTLTIPSFASSNSNVRGINFGTGKIVISRSTAATIWNTGTVTNFTTSGTPLVECIGGGTAITKTINTGALSEANSISFSFLETSGTVTYAFTASNSARNLIFNGVQTVTNIAITIYGSLTHQTVNGTTTFTAGTNAWTFGATSGTKTITTPAVTYDFPWTFNGVGGTWQLQNSITLGSTRAFTLTNGTFDFNGFSLSGPTSGITVLTGSSTLSNTGSNTFTTTLPVTHTSGTLNLGVDLTTTNATGYTLTAGTLALSTFTLTTPVFTSSGSTARTLNFGTGQLALTGNNTTIFNVATATNFTTSGTVYINSTYTGATGTRTFNTGFTEAQAAGYDVKTSGTAGIVIGTTAADIVALTGNYNNFDLTGLTNTLSNTTRTIYGNFTIPGSGGTITSGANATTFAGSGTELITTNGRTVVFPLIVNSTGTTMLADALTLSSTLSLTFTSGTLDFSNITIGTGSFVSGGTATRYLVFGDTGQLQLTSSSGSILDISNATNFTCNGNPYIVSTSSGASTRTFNFGPSATGITETNVLDVSITGNTGIILGTGVDTISLAGGFRNINLTGLAGTISSSADRYIYGNITLPSSGGTFSAGNGITYMRGASTSSFISNGRVCDFPVTVEKTEGVLKIVGALTLGATRAIFLSNGTIDLSDVTVTVASFSSTGSSTRSLLFGDTGQLCLVGNAGTIFAMATATNFTWAGNLYINSTYAGATGTRTFEFGSTGGSTLDTIFDVTVTGTSGLRIGTGATDAVALTGHFKNVNLTGLTNTVSNTVRTIYGNLILPATGGTLSAGTSVTTLLARNITDEGAYSVGFTSSNAHLRAAAGSFCNLNSGPVTVECWVYITSIGATDQDYLVSVGTERVSTSWSLGFQKTTNKVFFGRGTGSWSWASFVYTTTSITLNAWNHVAWVIDANNLLTIYINGVSGYSNTTARPPVPVGTFYLGTYFNDTNNSSDYTRGYVSNFRIVKSAVYTANFTVPTEPLTAISDTSLLICQSPGLVDNSSNNVALVGYNSLRAGSTLSPFPDAVSSKTNIIDANGRILDFPITIGDADSNLGKIRLASNLVVGSTRTTTLTFSTIELNNNVLTTGLFSSTNSNSRKIDFGTSGQITLSGSNATLLDFTTATNFSHIGTPRIYSNYSGATGTRTFNFAGTAGAVQTNIFDVMIGTSGSGIIINPATDTIALTGTFKNVDLTGLTNTVSNTARNIYGNLTIPNTGGTFTAGTTATVVAGLTTPDAAGYSIFFTGAERLQVAGSPISLNGPFTFETWFYCTSITTANAQVGWLYNQRLSGSSNRWGIAVVRDSGTNFHVRVSHPSFNVDTPTSELVYNGWYHLAVVRDSANTLTIYINGVAKATYANYTNNIEQTNAVIGELGNNGVERYRGYISNLRVVDDQAVYTSNFSVPTAPATAIAGTTLLLGQSTTIADGSVNNFTITNTGAVVALTTPFGTIGATQTFNVNGRTLDFPITIGDVNGTGGTIRLTANAALGSTRALTLAFGTLDLNNFTFTSSTLVSNNSNNRSIDFKSTGQITLVGSNATLLDFTTASGFTYSGTPRIYSNYSGATGTRTFNFGGTAGSTTLNSIDIMFGTSGSGIIINPGTDIKALTGGFRDVNFTSFAGNISNTTRTIYGNLTVPSTGGNLVAGTNTTTLSPGIINDFGYSVYFNGSSSFLSVPTNSAFAFGTGDFTIEAWIYTNSNSNTNGKTFYDGRPDSTNGAYSTFGMTNVGTLSFVSNNVRVVEYQTAFATGQWYHVAVTRASGTVRLFVNGVVSTNTATNNTDLLAPTDNVKIGTNAFRSVASDTFWNGYISNLRVLKGQALYTADFTPSTSPLTSITNTVLLVCQTSDIVDYGPNSFTVTNNSGAVTSVLTPFSGTSALKTVSSARTIDFPVALSGPGIVQLTSNLTLGNARTFTLTQGQLDLNNNVLSAQSFSSSTTSPRSIEFGSIGSISLVGNSTTIWDTTTGTNFSWSGNLQVNATYTGATGTRTVSFGTIAEQYAPNVKVATGSAGFNIGVNTDTLSLTGSVGHLDLTGFTGTLANAARTIYGNLTVPASGGTLSAGTNATTFGSTAGVEFINVNRTLDFPITFNGTGGTWALQNILSVGATRVVTLTNGTLDFNGQLLNGSSGITINGGSFTLTNSVLSTTDITVAITHTTGNLTLDTNLAMTAASGYTLTAGNLTLGTRTLTARQFNSSNSNIRYINFGSGKIVLNPSTTSTIWTTSTSANLTVTGNSLVECSGGGSAVTKTITTGTPAESNAISFSLLETTGTVTYALGTSRFKNLIADGLQSINNTAITIYGEFTNSTINGTTALSGGTNAWTFAGTNSSYKSTATGISGTGSGYFGGTTDYLSVSNNAAFNFGTGDFTLECWIFPTSAKLGQIFDNANSPASGVAGLFVNMNTTRFITAGQAFGVAYATSTAVTLNVWTHVAVVRNASVWTIYLNGVSAGTGTNAVNLTATGPATVGGNGRNTAETFQGYISNLRVVKGVPVYTDTFTPPSLAPLSTSGSGSISAYPSTTNVNTTFAASATSLLTCQFTTHFVDNSSNAFTITTVGAPVTTAIAPNTPIYDFPLIFNGPDGTFILQNDLILNFGRSITLTNGNLDLNGRTLTSGSFATATGVKSLIVDGGNYTITGSGATAWNNAAPTGFTVVKGTGAGTISLTSGSAKTFVGGNTNYSGLILDQGGAGTLTVTGSNTFEDLSATISTSAASTISFTAGTTTTFNKFTITGTTSFKPTLNSTTTGTLANFYSALAVSGFVTGADSIQIRDIAFTPYATNGTNFIHWYIGVNSTIINSTGALAQTYLAGSSPKVYVIESGTSWSVPPDFNTTNNIIHLIGGGGGGAGGRGSGVAGPNAGGGGAGGGYTRVTNFNPNNSQSIPYLVGAGGGGGPGTTGAGNVPNTASLGNDGGSTLFESFVAGGGARGASRGGSAAAGGAGTTFNGGAGTAPGGNSSGGGGGGAGGPLGTGRTGSLGTSDNGGGGGGNGGGTNASSNTGGNNAAGVGGATARGAAGTFGGGGAGGFHIYLGANSPGGSGGGGIDILNSIGGGGGGGGGSRYNTLGEGGTAGGSGGRYGGGGGGGQGGSSGAGSSGGSGAQGVIIIQYLPVTPKFLSWFG